MTFRNARTIVPVIAALAIVGIGWADAAAPKAEDGQQAADAKHDKMMQCPMMGAMKGLKLHADSPAVLLAQADKLHLTDQQKQKLDSLAATTRKQAAAVLTDDQRKTLADAPEGPLSMMKVVMLLKQETVSDKSDKMTCPHCRKMMGQKMKKMDKKPHKGGKE